MNEDKLEYRIADLEKLSIELVSMTFYVCETTLAKYNGDVKGLPSAATAVRESILTFLALVNSK